MVMSSFRAFSVTSQDSCASLHEPRLENEFKGHVFEISFPPDSVWVHNISHAYVTYSGISANKRIQNFKVKPQIHFSYILEPRSTAFSLRLMESKKKKKRFELLEVDYNVQSVSPLAIAIIVASALFTCW